MSVIKSFSVGNGDMFYIKHDSDNFTIIDCCMDENNQNNIIDEIERESEGRGVIRFISTHPDDDHFRGLVYLDNRLKIRNFYCVENKAIKEDETDDFKRYCSLRDGEHHFFVYKGCSRRWMNLANDERGQSGIDILWPITNNEDFIKVLDSASKSGTGVNNLSPILTYSAKNGMKAMWMGDMETAFLEKIKNFVSWPKVDVLFAPHHGRQSGSVTSEVLKLLTPRIIVIGEARSEYLNYYSGYKTITQNTAGDIVFINHSNRVDIYVSNAKYAINKPCFPIAHNAPYRDSIHGYCIGSFKPYGA